MKITLLSIFPESFDSFLSYPVISRARKQGIVEIECIDIKDYAEGCFRKIDDSPYGGGPGMIIRIDTLKKALDAVTSEQTHIALMSPRGSKFTQAKAHELSKMDHIVLISGHYEGVDERIESYIDEEISIGDYILTGGESASIIVAEAVIRLLDGALKKDSTEEESFESGILEYPQYTHPLEFDKKGVPSVLLTGNKEEITKWREKEAIKTTIKHRKDLLSVNRDFRYFNLKVQGKKEAEILKWLNGQLPVPKIAYEDGEYILLTKTKGKPLREAGRNKILKTTAAVLKLLWKIDISDCPFDATVKHILEKTKEEKHSFKEWEDIKLLEESIPSEDEIVFSHGLLSPDSIFVNGNGLTGISNFERAGKADKWRDITSAIIFLENYDIRREELLEILNLKADEEKISYYARLMQIL